MNVDAATDLLDLAAGRRFHTVLADPPWRFANRTGKVAPEHGRLRRYGTMALDDIMALPVPEIAEEPAHLYLWVPNALLAEGLGVMQAWGFQYKASRLAQGPEGRRVRRARRRLLLPQRQRACAVRNPRQGRANARPRSQPA